MKNVLVLLALVLSLTAFSQKHIGHIKMSMSTLDAQYPTDFYFNTESTRALDAGYDNAPFQIQPFSLYSYLVDDTGYNGLQLAVQSLAPEDINDVTINLSVNAFKGQFLTFKIIESDLTYKTKVILLDKLKNVQTDLTKQSYSFLAEDDLKGSGRFYLGFEGDVIFETPPPPIVKEQMNVSVDYRRGDVIMKGSIPVGTTFKFYYNNVLLKEKMLSTKKRQTVSFGGLMSGLYIIELSSEFEEAIVRLIIR